MGRQGALGVYLDGTWRSAHRVPKESFPVEVRRTEQGGLALVLCDGKRCERRSWKAEVLSDGEPAPELKSPPVPTKVVSAAGVGTRGDLPGCVSGH